VRLHFVRKGEGKVVQDSRPEWGVLRQKACEKFGVGPTENQEDQVVEIFRHRPNMVAGEIDIVSEGYRNGNVRSPWAVLAWRVRKEAGRADAANTITADRVDEPKQIRQTKTLIRNRIYLLEELDVALDEIDAALGPFAAECRDEMVELWRERRLQVGWG
jgi:hypothetical protein